MFVFLPRYTASPEHFATGGLLIRHHGIVIHTYTHS